MSSDSDVNIRLKADQQLLEIDKKYTGFIQVTVVLSLSMLTVLLCLHVLSHEFTLCVCVIVIMSRYSAGDRECLL